MTTTERINPEFDHALEVLRDAGRRISESVSRLFTADTLRRAAENAAQRAAAAEPEPETERMLHLVSDDATDRSPLTPVEMDAERALMSSDAFLRWRPSAFVNITTPEDAESDPALSLTNISEQAKLDAARSTEVRVVDPATGGEKGSKLARFDLIPADALTHLAEHYGRGALKYADRNWERGYQWSLSYAALLRHLTAWWGGEDIDAETGSHHLDAVMWHAFALRTFAQHHLPGDNRPTP